MPPRARSPASKSRAADVSAPAPAAVPAAVPTPAPAAVTPLRWWVVPAALTAIMLGCGLNVIFLEVLVKADPGAGQLITLAQFAFIALEGLLFNVELPADGGSLVPQLRARRIPLAYYVLQVLIFFVVSVLNNCVFYFDIAMPLHIIFRSGSLIVNMAMGVLILKKRYSVYEYAGVVLTTLGIVVATWASADDTRAADPAASLLWWSLGIFLLFVALVLSALLGIVQEWTYTRFGRDNYRENMFYSHALALPFFALFVGDIRSHFAIFQASNPVTLLPGLPAVPTLWLSLLGNVVTQYFCIRGVFTLFSATNSLTGTFAITVRKFVSLLFSVWFFQNSFSPRHWTGTLMLFLGAVLYMTPKPKPAAAVPLAGVKDGKKAQ